MRVPSVCTDQVTFQRYAIYYAPAESSALHRLGSSWLGWDACAGRSVPHPDLDALPVPLSEMTEAPRKYGLHGTLKPPFRLKASASVSTVETILRDSICTQPALRLPDWTLSRIGRFLALTPSEPCPVLTAFAASCVQALDHVREPAGEAELTRRRAAGLTCAQEKNLTRWGYPYVMEEFRFHVTLTGRLGDDHLSAVEATLADYIAPALVGPVRMTDVALFGEAGDGRFHLIKRFELESA